MRSKIGELFKRADEIDIREGLRAYERYRCVIQGFADHYSIPFDRTLAAFVALSPNNDYYGNLRSLSSVLEAVQRGYAIETATITTYNACRDRAHSYATGEVDFLSTVKGPKIRSFYHNIMNPNCKKHVTVDGHMIAAYLGKNMSMKEANFAVRKVGYERIRKAIKSLAYRNDMIPCQMQAIIWLTRKRINNIVYDGQLNFFRREDDASRILVTVAEAPPYKRKTL